MKWCFSKGIFFLFLVFCTNNSFSQKEGYNWYFGTKLGLSFNVKDTNTQRIYYSKLWGPDACSSISDSNGKLLLYTNGDYLFNYLHDTLAILNDVLRKDSLSIPKTQNISNGSTLIIPKPETDDLFYVIHSIGKSNTPTTLGYHTINMNGNRGKGEIWDSRKFLHKYVRPYMLASTRHVNRKDFWIALIDDQSRSLCFYLARIKGIYLSHQINNYSNWLTGSFSSQFYPKMKFSPNGDKLAMTYFYRFNLPPIPASPIILLLDFDNNTGLTKNPVLLKPKLTGFEIDSLISSGLEFSTDSRKLYAFGRQYNLDSVTETAIQNSEYRFYDINKTFGNISKANKSVLNDYQLGPDGRIYLPWKDTVDIIFNPGAPKDSCNFVLSDEGFVGQIGPLWVDHSEALPSFPSDFFKYEIIIQNNFDKVKWIKHDIEICEGSDLNLITNELLRSKYKWSGPLNYKSTVKDPVLKNMKPSMSGWYKIIAERNYGEKSEDSIYVKVKAMPSTKINPKGVIYKCKYTPIILKAEPEIKGNLYYWSTGENSSTISIDEPGKYYLTIFDSSGCSRIDSVEVKMRNLNPEIDIIGEQLSCEGDTVILRTKEKYSRYIWSTGDSTREIKISKNIRCYLGVVDSNGCAGYSKEAEVLFYIQPKTKLSGLRNVCRGGTQKYGILKTQKDSVIWEVTGGQILSKIGSDTIVVNWQQAGIGKVFVKQISNMGCIGKDSMNVDIGDEVKPEILPVKPVICGNGSVTLKTSEQFDSYEWSTGDTTDSILVTNGGLYSLKVTASGGCFGYDSVFVIRANEPIPQITGNKTICEGESTVLSVDNDFVEYLWNTGETSKDISVSQSGTYFVEVTDTNGCKGTTSIEVKEIVISFSGLSDIDFGRISIDSQDAKSIILTNTSNEQIRIETVRLKNANTELSISVTPQAPAVLDVGEKITIRINFVPDNFKEYNDSLNIDVSMPCIKSFSSDIKGIGTGEMFVWLPNVSHEVGSNICIPLFAKLTNKKNINIKTKFNCELKYDCTALLPQSNNSISLNDRIVEFKNINISLSKDTSVIAELCGKVLLANEDTTPLRISEFELDNPYFEIKIKDGNLTMLGCAIDISRVIKLQQPEINIYPNPAGKELQIIVRIFEKTQVKIELINNLGITSSEIFDGYMTSGEHFIEFSPNYYISSGTYWVKITFDNSKIQIFPLLIIN